MLAVGVAVLTKDTQAYLGGGSVVDAFGGGPALGSVPDGGYNGSTYTGHAPHGLAVVARSSEDVFGLAPAIAGGFVGVAGGVGVTVMNVTVKAFIGPSAQVNLVAGSAGGHSVNVSAID